MATNESDGHTDRIAAVTRASVTIRDVATAANVSLGTVSNVLNRPSLVAEETRQRVLDAIEALGFVRHAGAALLRGGRARTIGLVALDVHNPFFTELARGIEDVARENGQLLILCNSDEDAEQERRYLEVLEEQRVLGVLISPVDEEGEALAWLRGRGTAVVLLERQRRDYCSVRVDDVCGGELAAEHLLALGHRRLAFVSPSLSVSQYRDRLTGMRRAMERYGLPASACAVLDVGPLATAEAGREASMHLRRDHPEVTGVVCGNDLLALGLVAGLVSQRVSVPGAVSVVGYDDIELAHQSTLPLTTVRQPKVDVGRMGARLLLDEARSGRAHAHRQVVFQPELVVRDTTAALRSGGSAPGQA